MVTITGGDVDGADRRERGTQWPEPPPKLRHPGSGVLSGYNSGIARLSRVFPGQAIACWALCLRGRCGALSGPRQCASRLALVIVPRAWRRSSGRGPAAVVAWGPARDIRGRGATDADPA